MHDEVKAEFLDENQHDKEKCKFIEKLSQPLHVELDQMKQPRFIKTHLPTSLLPPSIFKNKSKVNNIYPAVAAWFKCICFFAKSVDNLCGKKSVGRRCVLLSPQPIVPHPRIWRRFSKILWLLWKGLEWVIAISSPSDWDWCQVKSWAVPVFLYWLFPILQHPGLPTGTT